MIAGMLNPNQFVAANACTKVRLAATTAGPAAAVSQLTYWVATFIIAAADAPCHEPLARSEVTEKNDDADDARSSASPSQAAAAASSGADPGPSKSSAELISGGNHAKCGLVTDPT